MQSNSRFDVHRARRIFREWGEDDLADTLPISSSFSGKYIAHIGYRMTMNSTTCRILWYVRLRTKFCPPHMSINRRESPKGGRRARAWTYETTTGTNSTTDFCYLDGARPLGNLITWAELVYQYKDKKSGS